MLYEPKHVALCMDEAERKIALDFSEGYKEFLNVAKTERESAAYAVKVAQAAGYKPYSWGQALKAGDKVYYLNRNKSVILAVIGTDDIASGVNIMAAHIDTCRLDLKQNPLYEQSEIAYFKTHYYGGIKKYQWVAIPLSLHGVVIMSNGEKHEICIGEDENDPVFYVTDLLPHLDKEKRNDVVTGEELNLLVGSIPDKTAKKDKIKSKIEKININIESPI